MAFPTPPSQERCARHPDAAAGWVCTQCGSRLCPACAGTRRAGATEYTVCCLCGGAVGTLRIPRASLSYLDLLIRGAWRYPLDRNGLLSMLGAGLFVYLVPGGVLGMLIKFGVVWTYLFSLVRQLANGEDHIEPPDFTDLFDFGNTVVRGLLAVSFLAVPVGAMVYKVAFDGPDTASKSAFGIHAPAPGPATDGRVGHSPDPDDEVAPELPGLASTPPEGEPPASEAKDVGLARRGLTAALVPWMIFAIIGLILTPMALLLAATQSSPLTILNPVGLVALIRRIPGDYTIALVTMLVLGMVEVAMAGVAGLISSIRIPIVTSLLASTMMFYGPFVTAYVLGALLWLRGAELGCLRKEESFVLALPGVAPRGMPPPTQQEQAASGLQRPRSISLSGIIPAQSPGAPREMALELTGSVPAPVFQRSREIPLEESGSMPAAPPASQRPREISLEETGKVPAAPPAYQRPREISLEETGKVPAAPPAYQRPREISLEETGKVPAVPPASPRAREPSPEESGTVPAAPSAKLLAEAGNDDSSTVPAMPSAGQLLRELAGEDDDGPEESTVEMSAYREGGPPGSAPARPRPVQLVGERAELFDQPMDHEAVTQVRTRTPVSAAVRVQRALRANRLDDALKIYKSEGLSPADLSGLDHFSVGRAAADSGDYALACKAYQAAAAANFEDPLAPRALVMAGRILGEQMKEPALAARIFQQVIQVYPDSESARAAKELLAGARAS